MGFAVRVSAISSYGAVVGGVWDGRARPRVERLKTAWGIKNDAEVACERRGKCCRSLVWVNLRTDVLRFRAWKRKRGGGSAYLVVDQTPLFQKGMDTHDSANVSSQVSPASSDGEILCGP